MTEYTMFVTRTTKYCVTVEAESIEDADTKVFEASEEEQEILDSDDEVESAEDNLGNSYVYSHGHWQRNPYTFER